MLHSRSFEAKEVHEYVKCITICINMSIYSYIRITYTESPIHVIISESYRHIYTEEEIYIYVFISL